MKKKKLTMNKVALTLISLALGVFFVVGFKIHDLFSNLSIRLHFCNHLACMIFALLWFLFAAIGIFLLTKKTKFKRFRYIPYIVLAAVLVIGIIFMNITVCDVSGGMSFGIPFLQDTSTAAENCNPGVDCPGDVVAVPIPPCIETDVGRDYITFGTILSGANLDDLCMGDVLRERYCDSELTYTSEDINCETEYGDDWTCEEGECRIEEATAPTPALPVDDGDPESDCGDGIDNDGDLLIDCADPDCDYSWFEGGCGDFDYSCEHNPTEEYPFCGGTCPPGEVCGDYAIESSSWCSCVPEDETSCVDSTGDGWCEEGYNCVEDSGEYYCEFDFGTCEDTDGGDNPLVGGFTIVDHPEFGILNIIEYCGFEKGDESTLYEYYCLAGEDMNIEYDCFTDFGLCCIEDPVDGSYCGECEF